MIDQAADVILSRWQRGGEPGSLPEALRPKNLPQAYGIQQAVSRELGAIGGWRICAAEPEVGLASAPLPLAALHPEPTRLPIAGKGPLKLRPALAFRVGLSLPEYEAPFTAEHVAAAIESTHPAILVFHSRPDENRSTDALTAIAESCGTAGVVYGQATPGLPDAGMVELRQVDWQDWKRSRVLRTAPIGNFVARLTWLANFGANWSGGLMVGQMIAFALPSDEIELRPGAWTKLVVGAFGKVELRAERAES